MHTKLIKKLTENVPFNCVVEIKSVACGQGWCMNEPEQWVKDSFDSCAREFFDGLPVRAQGCGGAIPFLAELGKLYPKTGIFATGVGGPDVNVHAPNECINLAYTKKLTCAMSHMIAAVANKK